MLKGVGIGVYAFSSFTLHKMIFFPFQPVFDALKQHVQALFEGELVPVKDRCTLTEALVIAR